MASSVSDAPTGGGRAQGLDGLRALAAFGVMLFHFWVYTEPLPPGAAPATVGQHLWQSTRWGLLLFFVLSGFLLYRPWVRAALAARERPGLAPYLRSRAARLRPADADAHPRHRAPLPGLRPELLRPLAERPRLADVDAADRGLVLPRF